GSASLGSRLGSLGSRLGSLGSRLGSLGSARLGLGSARLGSRLGSARLGSAWFGLVRLGLVRLAARLTRVAARLTRLAARLTRLARLSSLGSLGSACSNRIRGSGRVFLPFFFAPPDNARVRDVDGGRGWLSSAFSAASGTPIEVEPSTVTETEEEEEISATGGWKRNGDGWRPRRTSVA
uniref:Uncharacterized protein n=1 Tax=Cucumis melo TaxID=3656 RepID=A0A9I9E3B1_CUCME